MFSEIHEDVLVGHIINKGRDAFIECSDIINGDHLSGRTAMFWNLAQMIFDDHDAPEKLTWTMLLSKAQANGCEREIRDNAEYFKRIKKIQVSDKEFLSACKKITLNGIKWDLIGKHQLSEKELKELSSDCSIEELIATSEKHIFDYTNKLLRFEEDGGLIGDGLWEYLENLGQNPGTLMGISSGYGILDQLIGGGFGRGRCDFIMSRFGRGKSSLLANIGMHVSGNGIPVLALDTEMSRYDHGIRIVSNLTGLTMDEIKYGRFYQDSFTRDAIKDAALQVVSSPFYYRVVAGMDFSEILAYIRKWVVKKVSIDENGRTNDALCIYDYFKLQNTKDLSKNIAEHQALGFQLQEMITTMIKCDISSLNFAQLNRAGEDDTTLQAIGASDRLGQYASSVSLWQDKTNDEITRDGVSAGNMKLSLLKTRYGMGTRDKDYISYNFQRDINRITEVDLASNLAKKKSSKIEDEDTQNIPEL